ncbi:DUF4394 domain-containing protein [Curvibacter sp. HBC28]|uniref:DUF4394 domain-containing protein n=1 Tax=Curvibacter microcysteis TaxID=3026419 RepID=A0ABT5MI35_9BURK|nr:DUF4394 domain-containing protein [Curvibacter sp. HBC28]MDD0816251.1 DUF4394 domain-containing protein [Curvibacter sp. HBC28]
MPDLDARTLPSWALACAVLTLAACASPLAEPEGAKRAETLHVLTQDLQLLTVNAGQPGRVLARQAVKGLPAGDSLVGMDYRVARGVLFTLSRSGRLYTLDVATGQLKPVGANPISPALEGTTFGVDFNPTADRLRVVSNTGQNLRLLPDTGAVGVVDPALRFAPGDAQAGQAPELVGAAYTYNKKDDRLTTNYALDRRQGTLVSQGSVEGVQPVVSPNTGLLQTVGALGTGPLRDAAFDIADVSGAAFAALSTQADARTRLYEIDLSSGQARLIGTLAQGGPIVGMAVEP